MMTGDDLFWDLAEPMFVDQRVSRSTMMGTPCLRCEGRFLAMVDHRTEALLVKLPEQRVCELIDAGHGEPFAPAGRTFREWVAVPVADRRRWSALLEEAKAFAVDR